MSDSYSQKWRIERESLERNIVVVAVSPQIQLEHNGELTSEALGVIATIKRELGVEEYFAGVYDPRTPGKLYFQYPTQKIMRVGDVVRVNIPANMLRTTRDYVTIKKNPDGTILIVP